ncbi:hypothetical protein C2E21_3710 [Chlorella sorokiniana]|uniref:Uncharacterized protein n=1 Tax=Chlorella sorokiniana TaxID=3076 RepID=A0A2P6TUC5_CHLSO|nr:hypothetical protein C2E21_3710 [Chlorella sorokiniana]|eukprot:PRW57659.1 hypothetical protein C2E21_3710 [Chlorella sorokiniana]
MLQAQADKNEYARSLSHCVSGCIAAVHPDQAAVALAAAGAFPALGSRACAVSTPLAGAWAARQQTCATTSADAIDVQPKQPVAAAARPYVPPALRPGAEAATLAGCPMPHPAAPVPVCRPAAYVPPYRRTAEQQAAAAAAPRPGRPGLFPALAAGPQPAPQPAPLPLYRQALLRSSLPLQCWRYVPAEPASLSARCTKRLIHVL